MSRRAWWLWWLVAGVLLGAGAVVLGTATSDITRTSGQADGLQYRVVSSADAPDAPAVVLAHGFAGSAAMMDPLASALARAGYLVVLPDLPGHGGNAEALTDESLEPAIADAVAVARGLTSGPVSVAGHSMGAGAVTRWASTAPEAASPGATVAISLPSAEDLPAEPARPPNLLVLWGSAEQPRFADAALAALHRAYPEGVAGVTYGSTGQRTARRAVQISGAEHVSVVYRAQTAGEIAAWLGGGQPQGDARWIGLVLVLAGGVLATRPLLTGVRPGASGAAPDNGVRSWVAAAWLGGSVVVAGLGAAAVTGLAERIPVAVGGYLMAWFACGAAVLMLAGRRGSPVGGGPSFARGIAAGIVLTLALALPARLTWAAFHPVGPRWWVLLLLLAVLGGWLLGEARLVLGRTGWRRAGLLFLSRVLVVVGLLGAVALLGAPAFLTLTVPLVIPILAVLAVVAGWSPDPASAAAAQAIPLATAIATTFPLLG